MATGMKMSVATLQDCLAHDVRIWGHCGSSHCSKAEELDLAKLIEHFGADYSYIADDRLRNALRCTRCGHKGGTITIAHRRIVRD